MELKQITANEYGRIRQRCIWFLCALVIALLATSLFAALAPFKAEFLIPIKMVLGMPMLLFALLGLPAMIAFSWWLLLAGVWRCPRCGERFWGLWQKGLPDTSCRSCGCELSALLCEL
jgi:hypothetical protein